MDGYVIRDFLMKDRVAGLNLLFVNGDKEQVDEIEPKKLNGSVLFVEEPEQKVINLDQVISIKAIYELDTEAADKLL